MRLGYALNVSAAREYSIVKLGGARDGKQHAHVQIAVHTLEQLRLMHSAGFVHADVKPSNIMWSDLKHRWLIIDFSDSHRVDAWGNYSCTAEWAPPESLVAHLAGHKVIQYTIDFDMYSVAAVLWAQITGDRPFAPLLAAGHEATNMDDDAVRKQVLNCSCAKLRGRHVAVLQTDTAHWHMVCTILPMKHLHESATNRLTSWTGRSCIMCSS